MTRAELEAALAKCEGHTPGPWAPQYYTVWAGDKYIAGVETGGNIDHKANARLIALAPSLASALREAWEEIDRLKAHLSNPLDAALNEGDGIYRP